MCLPYPELMPNTVARSPQEALSQYREYKHRVNQRVKYNELIRFLAEPGGTLTRDENKPDGTISHTLTREE